MIEITYRGPIFQAGAAQIIERWCDDLADAYARRGFSEVHMLMDANFKHPTPYYETQVTIDTDAPNQRVIHDRGIVYGPWLEGVGSRNATTRFKGYHMWRRTAQALVEDRSIVDRMTSELVQRLN